MSRIVLLFMVMVWMGRSSAPVSERMKLLWGPQIGPLVFLAGYAGLVLLLAFWSRRLAPRLGDERSERALSRFNMALYIARILIPVWLAAGVFVLGWDRWVESWLGGLEHWPWRDTHIELPQALVGTAPSLLAWIGLIWAQYPIDRALREQSVFLNLDDDLPVREPPGLRRAIGVAMRLQVAFTLVPVLMILVVRDLTTAGIRAMGWPDPQGQENWVILPATVAIFVLAPELLRRVLRTEPLPDGPLRRRLEQMCRDSKLKYRQILLWHTDGTMGNAAVMGMVAPVRYILLSDLLLETMTDTQVEAVFAHELGHVVHHHIVWYAVFAAMIMGFVAGPGDMALVQVHQWMIHFAASHHFSSPERLWADIQGLVAVVIAMGSFLLAFGFLSPRFERQADVYAARTMQKLGRNKAQQTTVRRSETVGVTNEAAAVSGVRAAAVAMIHAPSAATSVTSSVTSSAAQPIFGSTSTVFIPTKSHVGEYGAGVFASALYRVATINNIPVAARNWSHGSIAQRMRYLQEISGDPAYTHRFDRLMNRLYATLLVALGTFGTWGAIHSTGPTAEGGSGGTRVVTPGSSRGVVGR